jgi:hypothetical protein
LPIATKSTNQFSDLKAKMKNQIQLKNEMKKNANRRFCPKMAFLSFISPS